MKNTILFFDDYMLLEYTNVKKRIFAPHKVQTISPEHTFEIQSNIVYIPERDVYFMARQDLVIQTDLYSDIRTYESKDLVDWTLIPEEQIQNSPHLLQSNIVYDKFEPDAEKRYKAANIARTGENAGYGFVSTSPDALNWKEGRQHHFCEHISDSRNMVFYNAMHDEYQVFMRGDFIERRIFTSSSKDLKTWTKPHCLMMPSPDDEPCVQYYGMPVFPMDGYFLAYLWKYQPPVYDAAKNKMAGITDAYLVYSYDGYCWHQISNRPLVERSLPPAFGNSGSYLNALNPTPDKSKWLVSGNAYSVNHACGFKPVYPDSELPKLAVEEGFMGTNIYEIRSEGFAAMESISYQSSIYFKSIVLYGEVLMFNICAPMGWVKFQLHDADGKIVEGFSFEDCIPFVEDDNTRYQPMWKTKRLSDIKGKPIRIKIIMSQALIFSVWGDFYVKPGKNVIKSLGDTQIADI